MRYYTKTTHPQLNFTNEAGSFLTLLKQCIGSFQWNVIEETSLSMKLQNKYGFILDCYDDTDLIYLRGFRSISDVEGFPTRLQNTVNNRISVILNKTTPTSWFLFIEDQVIYFIVNDKFFSFGHYIPFFETSKTPHYILGQQTINDQRLLVSSFQTSDLLFVESQIGAFPFSRWSGISLFNQVSPYQNITQTIASPIALHNPNTRNIIGFLPKVFIITNDNLPLGLQPTMAGFSLFNVKIGIYQYGFQVD